MRSLPSRHGAKAPIYLTEGGLEAFAQAISADGCEHVLLVSDVGLQTAGHVALLKTALSRAGVASTPFLHCTPNPTASLMARCAEAFRQSGCDGLVALGGGSVIDTAKGAAFLANNPAPITDYHGPGPTPAPLPPIFVAPTTGGTGSESQSFTLVSRDKDHVKVACGAPDAMPRVVLLDPQLTLSAPRGVTLASGLDAIGHAVETLVTTLATPASQAIARRAWSLLWPNLPKVLERPDDLEARRAMLWGSCLAGQAIEASMLGAAHALANPLTAQHDLEHGLAVATMLPAVVRFNGESPEVATLYRTLSPEPLHEVLSRRWRELGVSPKAHMPLTALNSTALAKDALGQWTGRFNPRKLTQAVILRLYEDTFG